MNAQQSKALEFANTACRSAFVDSCESRIPMQAYCEVYEATEAVRRLAALSEAGLAKKVKESE